MKSIINTCDCEFGRVDVMAFVRQQGIECVGGLDERVYFCIKAVLDHLLSLRRSGNILGNIADLRDHITLHSLESISESSNSSLGVKEMLRNYLDLVESKSSGNSSFFGNCNMDVHSQLFGILDGVIERHHDLTEIF